MNSCYALPKLCLPVADSGSCDRPIDPTNNQYIVWGIGSLGETAFQHHTRATSEFAQWYKVHESA